MGKWNPTGYSASVRMWLLVGEKRIPLSHTASTYVIARHPVDLPPGNGRIVFTVDDHSYERPITLVNGMSSTNREAMVLSRDAISPF